MMINFDYFLIIVLGSIIYLRLLSHDMYYDDAQKYKFFCIPSPRFRGAQLLQCLHFTLKAVICTGDVYCRY